jgi:AraC-like DNA-binding protein
MMDARVRKILIMVDSRKNFTIRNLALEFNLSPSYLQRLFKHQTGVPMGKWLSESRLRRAAQLITNGYMSVKEIAHSVGSEHASSFIRAFERRFARAPACYGRQSIVQNANEKPVMLTTHSCICHAFSGKHGDQERQ